MRQVGNYGQGKSEASLPPSAALRQGGLTRDFRHFKFSSDLLTDTDSHSVAQASLPFGTLLLLPPEAWVSVPLCPFCCPCFETICHHTAQAGPASASQCAVQEPVTTSITCHLSSNPTWCTGVRHHILTPHPCRWEFQTSLGCSEFKGSLSYRVRPHLKNQNNSELSALHSLLPVLDNIFLRRTLKLL